MGENLNCIQRGRLVKLNRTLIHSVFGGTATGHADSWLDGSGPRGAARYGLEAVNLDGTRSWAGSAVAR